MNGDVVAEDYEDEAAANPMIDQLRDKMVVVENEQYTKDYLDPEKRSIANAVHVKFKDGTTTENVAVEYPLGHRFRRQEAFPEIVKKFEQNIATRFASKQANAIEELLLDDERLQDTPVHELMALLAFA